MFDSVLIANRGVVACRILRACRALGLRALVAHSQADAGYVYVREADAAICIGPGPARLSYLDGDTMLMAAATLGAQAVHPGYGFLSENAAFARAVVQAGLVFVGPSADCIAGMGDKIAAKQAMLQAGVPCVPGSEGAVAADAPDAEALAAAIGYPVLVKAAGGGGGRGMRVVQQPQDLRGALATTAAEARQAFGSAEVYLEKYLAHPRHVEIQVLCDQYGNGVWLGSRDCSMQRRHQKVIEESPAPGLDASVLNDVGAACLRACRDMGYVGVGTFEFLVEEGRFFFIEMNTRLQVEHGISEMVHGVDIVQWQLRIARGEPLTLQQHALPASGHAIECRINAEDARTFVPTPGRLVEWSVPAARPGLRVETHLRAGDLVSPLYDSMVAKLLCHAPSREAAMAAMVEALAGLRVAGVSTNLALHSALLRDAAFQQGPCDVHYLESALERLLPAGAAT